MKECKKCKIVKWDWQFVETKKGLVWPIYYKHWLCKKCAKEIASEKIMKELAKYDQH